MAWDGDEYQRRFDALAAKGVDVHGEAAFVMAYAPRPARRLEAFPARRLEAFPARRLEAFPARRVEAFPARRLEAFTVLDAGCGTGRVGAELARRGVEVVGVDVDASMLATARRSMPEVEWVQSDLADLDLGRSFDVVVMAGNVPLFTAPGTHAAVVAGCARHVGVGGVLVAGFQLDRGYALDEYDAHAAAAGLRLVERFATWDRAPFVEGADYTVSVHVRDD